MPFPPRIVIGWQIGEGFGSPGGPVDLDARFQCRPQAKGGRGSLAERKLH